jgi:hypothetical protein
VSQCGAYTHGRLHRVEVPRVTRKVCGSSFGALNIATKPPMIDPLGMNHDPERRDI